jgi:two-component system phosphate regulon sensor histidine kinase PhoR
MQSPGFVVWTYLVAAVATAVFAALVLFDQLDPLLAGLGWAAILSAQLLFHRRVRDQLTRVWRAIEGLATHPDDPAPILLGLDPIVDNLWNGILRLSRIWRNRIAESDITRRGAEDVLDGLPDPILVIDGKRRVLRMNAAARTLFGAGAEGRDFAAALRNPAVLAAVDGVIEGGPERDIEFDLAFEGQRHLRARVERLPGTPLTVLVSFTDLTTIKRLEQMRADFVANASHELRTPLSTLVGFIETLEGPAADDPEAQARFLPIMRLQAARMARLVDDLLSLSRIEMNEHHPPTGIVKIGEVLESVIRALELRASARRMALELDWAPDLRGIPRVSGDEEELAQVIQNLIDNAIKYGRAGTTVRVEFAPSNRLDPGVAITVRDQGEGIPRIHLDRLTERFYRVDTARSRELGGTGLGLAIVKHIVNRHRGYLEIDSEPGRGSAFTVHLRRLPIVPYAEDDPDTL